MTTKSRIAKLTMQLDERASEGRFEAMRDLADAGRHASVALPRLREIACSNDEIAPMAAAAGLLIEPGDLVCRETLSRLLQQELPATRREMVWQGRDAASWIEDFAMEDMASHGPAIRALEAMSTSVTEWNWKNVTNAIPSPSSEALRGLVRGLCTVPVFSLLPGKRGRGSKQPVSEMHWMVCSWLLEAFGEKAASIVPELLDAVESGDQRIGKSASKVLEAIPASDPACHLRLLNAVKQTYYMGLENQGLTRALVLACREVPVLLSTVVELLDSDSRDHRLTCLSVLAQLETAAASVGPRIRAAVKDPDPDVKASALWALASCATQEAIPGLVQLLVEHLRAPEWWIRSSAISALGKLGGAAAPAVPLIIEALSDPALHNPDITMREVAIGALADIGVPEHLVLRALLQVLEEELSDEPDDDSNGYPSHRVEVAIALGKFGSAAAPAVPGLLHLVKEGRWSAGRAAMTLAEIGRPAEDAIPLLIELGQDPEHVLYMNDLFVESIHKFGPMARSAEPALLRCLLLETMAPAAWKALQSIHAYR